MDVDVRSWRSGRHKERVYISLSLWRFGHHGDGSSLVVVGGNRLLYRWSVSPLFSVINHEKFKYLTKKGYPGYRTEVNIFKLTEMIQEGGQ